jgi:hypothetical protein
MNLISENRHANVYGSPMFVLCKWLKLLKGCLKKLNKLHFSHISKMVAKAESTLEQHQTILHNDRDNTHLLTCDKHFRVDIVNLKFAKKMLYA